MITAGSILGAAGLVPLLTAERLVLRRLGFVLWALGMVVVASDLLSSVVAHLRVSLGERPAAALAAALVAAGALAAATALLRRRPQLLLPAVVAVAPIRIPFAVGGSSAKLLVPLYLLLAVCVAEAAWSLARGDDPPARLGRVGPAAALFLGWSALSLLWDADLHAGGISLLFYLLPFGFLLFRLGRLAPQRRTLAAALTVEVGLGVLFALVALWQEATHHIFWNPVVEVGNQYRSYFRVNSLFWDASIFGRFMVVAIVLVAGTLVVLRHWRWPLVAFLPLALAGVWFSYSQSSYVALAAGVLVLGLAVWPTRLVLGIAAVGLVAGLVAFAVVTETQSAQRVTSGRSRLVQRGLDVVRDRPLLGAGAGGFARAAAPPHAGPSRLAHAQSHTTPLTVLAELGPLGLAAYLWLLVCLVRGGLGGGGPGRVLLAALAVLVASSLFYNAFFEDPATWIVMALIALLHVPPARSFG